MSSISPISEFYLKSSFQPIQYISINDLFTTMSSHLILTLNNYNIIKLIYCKT